MVTELIHQSKARSWLFCFFRSNGQKSRLHKIVNFHLIDDIWAGFAYWVTEADCFWGQKVIVAENCNFFFCIFLFFSCFHHVWHKEEEVEYKADVDELCIFRCFLIVYVLQNQTFNNLHVTQYLLHFSLNREDLFLFCSLRCGHEVKLKDGFEGWGTISKGGSGKEQVEMQKVEEEEEVQERKEK